MNAPARHPGLPDIPTAIEAGLPGMITQNFFGIFAPAGTPKAMLDRVNELTQAALADKDFQQRLSTRRSSRCQGYGPEKSPRLSGGRIRALAQGRGRGRDQGLTNSDAKAFVMPGLVPGIYVLKSPVRKDVDGRDKPGHDREFSLNAPAPRAITTPRCW